MISLRFVLSVILLALVFPSSALSRNTGAPPSPAEVNEPEITDYQDWTLQCLPASTDNQPSTCAMVQQLLVGSGERLMAMQISEAGIADETEGSALVAVFSLPLGVYLPTGLRISIDSGQATRVEFERCDRGGCYAGLLLDNRVIDAMKGGAELLVRFNNLDGRTISSRLSLNGFTAAYAALVRQIGG